MIPSSPEVNIGISCANAPVLRPLYLFFQGRLQTQKIASIGISEERIKPSNNVRSGSTKLQGSPGWKQLSSSQPSTDTRVSLEMGLPMHDGHDERDVGI